MEKITETPRLVLRVWTMEDTPAGFRLWGDSVVMHYISDDGQGESEEEIILSMERGIEHQKRYDCQHWAVVSQETQEILGCCGFNVYQKNKEELEICFHFMKEHWGQGYATEAANAALIYAQENLKPQRIVASVHPENKASLRVLEKVGFSSQGTFFYEDTQEEEIFCVWDENKAKKRWLGREL